MNMSSVEVIDLPMNDLLKGMGQECLPGDHPAALYTIRQTWNLRVLMAPQDVLKVRILMEVLSGLTLEGLYDLKEKYNKGGLTPEEGKKVAAMKAAMQ